MPLRHLSSINLLNLHMCGIERKASNLPESVKRVGAPVAVPNEYPGQNVDFNWALNYDGVTPLKKAAFRMIKPLDVKIAGLEPCKTTPLKVRTFSCHFFFTRFDFVSYPLLMDLD